MFNCQVLLLVERRALKPILPIKLLMVMPAS